MLGTKKNGKTPVYRPDPTEDRYNPGLRAFNDVSAEARVQRRNAMFFAWGCLALAIIMGVGMIATSQQPRLVPYVVEVDKTGVATSLGSPQHVALDSSVTTAAIQYQLRQFIQAFRSATFDPTFQAKLIDDYVKPFLAPQSGAETLVNNYYAKNNPFTLAHDRSMSIDVSVDEPVPATTSTFELHWFETTKNAQGRVVTRSEWKGFATIELRQVQPEQVPLNPLGVYLKDLTVQQVGASAEQNAGVNQ